MSDFIINNEVIKLGEHKRITINTAKFYDFTTAGITAEIIRGKKDGPVLLISAAIHGDEISGIDIIRKFLKSKKIKGLSGTLIIVPIVNVFGFNSKSRYLPDRRDLNRCFPGSTNGSLTSQIAHIFRTQIVAKATHVIDFHSGAIHRTNLPQIRVSFENEDNKRLAEIFGAPVIMNSDVLEGSLREATDSLNIPTLLFEGGQALRFDKNATKIGVNGILNVMREIGMLKTEKKDHENRSKTFIAKSSYWLRAPTSGILDAKKGLGDLVKKGQVIATITDPFGANISNITPTYDGIIIGMSMIPLFSKGDAMFHIATFENAQLVEDEIYSQTDEMNS